MTGRRWWKEPIGEREAEDIAAERASEANAPPLPPPARVVRLEDMPRAMANVAAHTPRNPCAPGEHRFAAARCVHCGEGVNLEAPAPLPSAQAAANGEPYSAYKTRERLQRDAADAARPVTPPEIARAWQAEGQLVRVPTGFPTLDEACRGGLPIPWRLVIVGAPSAGKSAIAMVLAHRFATVGGLVVGVLGVDEEPEDLTVRLAQMAGFTIAQCEGRDPVVLEQMAESLAGVRVRFYDARHTIEAAADDVAAWAAQEGRRPALVLDSLQTVRAIGSVDASGPRELVDLNLSAIRAKGTEHRMLMVATSEANRGSYRNDDAAETSSDMAAGKESGGIEFGAQTLMVLRTPKGHPDHVHVRVPKNRRGARAGFEFFLRLDRERHELAECTDPTTDPDAASQAAAQKRQHNRSVVDADAVVLAGIVRTRPGIGERELRGAIRATGHRWGVERLNGARELLRTGRRGERLVDRGTGKGCEWHLEQTGTGGER